VRRQPLPEYWNHNTAYHPWLIDIAARHRGDVLEVGCGDGLLAQRLAPVSRTVTGIDPDPCSVERAIDRVAPSVGSASRKRILTDTAWRAHFRHDHLAEVPLELGGM
jgi:SAM-dependent methyltransferase